MPLLIENGVRKQVSDSQLLGIVSDILVDIDPNRKPSFIGQKWTNFTTGRKFVSKGTGSVEDWTEIAIDRDVVAMANAIVSTQNELLEVRNSLNEHQSSENPYPQYSKSDTFTPQMFDPIAGKSNLLRDDSDAIISAIQAAINVNGTVDLSSGKYRITRPLGQLINKRITIKGDGKKQCSIFIDPSLEGDLLSFSNTWYGSDTPINSSNVEEVGNRPEDMAWDVLSDKKSGVNLYGFSIYGDRRTTAVQNGIIFYDRNDDVYFDVDISFVKGIGVCFSGLPSNRAVNRATVMRESVLKGHIRWCGDSSTRRPAVMFNSTDKVDDALAPFDDANNYNSLELKIVYSDGFAFWNNCLNRFAISQANNRYRLIIDGTKNTNFCQTRHATNQNITNGILTVPTGANITGTISVNQYLMHPLVPPNTYVSEILTGTGGVGTYRLGNDYFDISNLTIAAASITSLRLGITPVQIDGGHDNEDWDIIIASSPNSRNCVGISINQNSASINGSKMTRSTMKIGATQHNIVLNIVDIGYMHIHWTQRPVGVSYTSIQTGNIGGSLTVDAMTSRAGEELNIEYNSGNAQRLHVYPGGINQVTTLPPASKFPNARLILNNSGTLTDNVSRYDSVNNTFNWVTV